MDPSSAVLCIVIMYLAVLHIFSIILRGFGFLEVPVLVRSIMLFPSIFCSHNRVIGTRFTFVQLGSLEKIVPALKPMPKTK